MAALRKALIVGCNYTGTSNVLNGCIADAENTYNTLTTKCGYLPAYTMLITDNTTAKPNMATILAGFKWLLTDGDITTFNDTETKGVVPFGSYLYFHFSGHGEMVNGADGKDSCIVPLEISTPICEGVIRSTLTSKVPIGVKLRGIMDSCYSGTGFDNSWTMAISQAGETTVEKDNTMPDLAGDVILFSGASDAQTAADVVIDGKNVGAFTYAWLHNLAANNYKSIPCDALLTSTRSYIITNEHLWQTPQISFGRSCPPGTTFDI